MPSWSEMQILIPDEDAALLRLILMEKMGFKQVSPNALARDDSAVVSYGPWWKVRDPVPVNVEDPVLD